MGIEIGFLAHGTLAFFRRPVISASALHYTLFHLIGITQTDMSAEFGISVACMRQIFVFGVYSLLETVSVLYGSLH